MYRNKLEMIAVIPCPKGTRKWKDGRIYSGHFCDGGPGVSGKTCCLLVDTTFALLWRAADFFDEQVPWG